MTKDIPLFPAVRGDHVNSDNNKLSSAQQEYFSDSKVRDDDGRLKVMCHGSTSAGFRMFDPQCSDNGISLFCFLQALFGKSCRVKMVNLNYSP